MNKNQIGFEIFPLPGIHILDEVTLILVILPNSSGFHIKL